VVCAIALTQWDRQAPRVRRRQSSGIDAGATGASSIALISSGQADITASYVEELKELKEL
jgi:hypothetical protein